MWQHLKTFWPGCIKRCQIVVKVNIMSSDLIGGYLTFHLNQSINQMGGFPTAINKIKIGKRSVHQREVLLQISYASAS
jgi:hypothetical protein